MTTHAVHDVVLTPEEEAAWDEFVTRHADEFKGAMARALTDDAREGWEDVAAVPPVVPELSPEEEFKYGMARALFDDVREGWDR